MVKTYGLTHIALAVRDVKRSYAFYRKVFGLKAYAQYPGEIHTKSPNGHDIVTFNEKRKIAGKPGGIAHFGFRLMDPKDIGTAIKSAKKAGGKILRQGEFKPGYPYVYFLDPDGYEIEVWYE